MYDKAAPVISKESLGIKHFKLIKLESEALFDTIDTIGLHRHDCYQLFWFSKGSLCLSCKWYLV